jgi:diguanylate cyclase (GGDEF)-like protein
VLYLDLDQFKDVNDTLGHPIGDELLKAVAGRLKTNTRNVDLVARFGGDEFAVLVCDIGEAANAAIVADTIIKAMAAPFMIAGNDIRSGVSIGISLFGSDEPDTETILSRADVALYRAKSERTGEYRFHTNAMDNEIRTRVTLGAELREGIALGQLFLEYQPQVNIATGRVTGVEALVRWRHPSRGVLGPNLFIPVAEKSGLIAALGHWVLRQACAQAKQWGDAGIAPEAIAVNLSAVQFKRAFELETEIANVLAETGLPPGQLELELTETVLMAASREHNDVLQRLRESGVRLAIDDFGVGYSSLDYLRRFPARRIKVAQAFVSQIATEPGSAAIVKATIGLARELGIAVVAMGVESPAQLDLLKAWGCPEAQGFHFARPLAAEDVALLFARGSISAT